MTDSITGDVFIDELAMFLDSDTLMLSGVEHSIEVDLSSDLPLGMMFASESRSDNQSGSSSCNDNGHETAVKTILREKETKRRRVYRQKQKDERNALLCQVQDLTLTLEKAKQAELERNARQEEASKSTSGDDNVCVGKWKTLAVWEWESLCRAQDEQKRLQAAASAKAQLIKDLQKVIYKRIERKSLASNPKLSTTRPSDVVVYEAYLQELDTNYARIDEMFRTLAVSTMKETSTNLTRTNPTAGCTKEFLHVNKRLLPFQFLSTCQIFWKLARLEHRQLDRELYGDAKDPENTIAVKFRVSSVTNTGATVSMRQRLVARRYVKPDSFVYVWKLFVEGEGIFQGMHSDESGWCRLSPSTSQVGTSMEMLVRRSLMHYRSAERSGQATSHFDDIMRDSTNEDQKIFMQGLDQLLLDNALNGDSW